MKCDDRRLESGPTTPAGGSGTILAALVAGTVAVGLPQGAAAYVGPGAGLTMLGALWAVIAAILFALAGLLIWPIRAMRRRKQRTSAKAVGAANDDGASGD